MKTEHQLHIKYNVFNKLTDLPEKAQNLMKQAITTREKAYAPYSKFKVGAAVLLKNGQTFVGSNQENAAYPSGLCAERVAIYQAATQYPDEEIEMIAISGSAQDPTAFPVSPCGACRQSLSEYETKQKKLIPVYFMGAEGEIVQTESIKDLLPFLFDGSLM
ncbi:cytidine deaminase [Capnocytophaga genosp. AHN8471]|jgi:cytidine deaminase|uniref:Cytidine deaminase n=3 Tax=Capnocytophaga TaxID=1016 RepID=A0A1Z4BPF4_9FLAO|nr:MULTISPECIES: cytidine deaminase [Capnocytophaga]ASF43171.1 cytidine deaminase [Capnocytophaga endodontalis]EKY16784.1 cytidine deaminase [Capnocytophaga sp. oral taxon 326 str. F0382]MBI1646079.1 cytidine deaminase [Capnocytophaga periodontitidis]MBM0650560.1 cytidine deaminase [Capnocytophaga genosp. AHN8471]MBM0653651.1 cytidine deaminase [Capnocytophaga genosp. AHN8471]